MQTRIEPFFFALQQQMMTIDSKKTNNSSLEPVIDFFCIFVYVLCVSIASFVCPFLACRPSPALMEKDGAYVGKQCTTRQYRCGVPLHMSSLVQMIMH